MTSLIYHFNRTNPAWRRSARAALLVTALVALATASQGAPIPVYNTGVNGAGVSLPGGSQDPHWSVDVNSGPAIVLSSGNLATGVWTADDAASSWISRTDAISPGPAPYTFSETFSLAGLDPLSAVLAGTLWGDDVTPFYLNGHQILPTGSYTGTPFNVNDSLGWFNAGVNTLTITMASSDNYLEGVRLQVAGKANPVPELGSLLVSGFLPLFALGAGALGLRRRNSAGK